MKIQRISVYQVDLPLHEGSYNWSGGKSVEVFDRTIVQIDTDSGFNGYGEVCPLGPFYLPAYAAGARAGIAESGQPRLIGEDPTQLGETQPPHGSQSERPPLRQNRQSTWPAGTSLVRLPANRSALCSADGIPMTFVLYRAISQESPEQMAGKGRRLQRRGLSRFQLKVGGDPDEDIERIRAVAGASEPGRQS